MIDDYTRKANLHRPNTAAGIAAAVRHLSSNGYSSRDIAGSLGLDHVAVERLLQTDFHESTLRTQS